MIHLSTFCLQTGQGAFTRKDIFEKSFSDHQKLILSVFRSYFIRIPPKTIEYRKCKNFNETVFFHSLRYLD